MKNVVAEHIEITAGIAGGKPRIAGHRITVQNIVVWHERLGMSPDQIASEHHVTLSDVHAALAYYHDHRQDIDDAMRSDESFIAELRKNTASILREKLGG